MMTAKTTPFRRPTDGLAADDAPGVGASELAGRERPHRDRHGLRAGIAAHGGDDGHQHRERHHLLDRALEEPDDRGGDERRAQLTKQPGEAAALGMVETRIGEFFVAIDAAERLDVRVGLLFETSTMSSTIITPTRRPASSTTGAETRL